MGNIHEFKTRLEIDVGLCVSELEEAQLELQRLPENVRRAFTSCLSNLLLDERVSFLSIERFPATDAGDGVIRLKILGVGELCAAALRAVETEFY